MKAQQLQKQLDAVKAEEAQLLDKAAKAALKVEAGDGGGVFRIFLWTKNGNCCSQANLQDSQKSVDQELQLKGQKVLASKRSMVTNILCILCSLEIMYKLFGRKAISTKETTFVINYACTLTKILCRTHSMVQPHELISTKVLNLQHQKLENAARIQSLQKEMAEARTSREPK